ncbi:RNA-dependent RNA polymerase [Hubei odonate virus 11]|uniref:RNA-directed RNA polymerase L n=1 Tax=Hubei odonate virus 11 TaxID=1922992 RepID=A0A1L3KMQ9_9VIRU|nr:RNA-dependent RNA polymerase [Hubei odonate virus 11]APG78700.1 RNA-dependent RNA polymerase [Hubei odonate virus 11]
MYAQSQTKDYSNKNPFSILGDRKFDTALRASTCLNCKGRLVKNDDTKLNPHDKLLKESFKNIFDDDLVDLLSGNVIQLNQNILPAILIKTLRTVWTKSFSHGWERKTNQIVSNLLSIQSSYHLSNTSQTIKSGFYPQLKTWCDKTTITKEVSRLCEAAWLFEQLITKINQLDLSKPETLNDYKKCSFNIPQIEFKCIWNGRISVIEFNGTYVMVPQSYLILIHNKLCDIISVLVAAQSLNGSGLEDSCYESTVLFIVSLCKDAQRYKSKFIEYMKVLEGIGVGLTLIDVDGPTNDVFLRTLLFELQESYRINVEGTTAFEIMRSASIAFRHELMCLSKIFGHPFVDMQRGSFTIRDNAHKKSSLDSTMIKTCVMNAKRSLIKGHILRYGKWPIVHFKTGCHPALINSCFENADPESIKIRSRYGIVKLDDYDYITIGYNKELSKYDNFLPFLKDRTLSVLRSKVVGFYIEKINEEKPQWEETRVLLHYLMSSKDMVDHVKYITKFENSCDLNELLEYMIIRIVPKEKELKEVFRGFGCQSYFERARRIVQEKAVSEYLDLYYHNQAMTLDYLGLVKKLRSLATIKDAYPGYTPICLVVDSSKWCNMWRSDVVDEVCKETLGPYFGTRLWDHTMHSYQKTLFYVPDEEETYYWYGQDGGIEGLNQYTWTFVYIEMLKTCLGKYVDQIPIQIMCKGDDVRIFLMIPPEILETTTIDEFRQEVLQTMIDNCAKFGHKVNFEESYCSGVYFAFSKQAYCDGIELPQLFRKIQKSHGTSNTFVSSLDEQIGAGFSNCHGSSRVTHASLTPLRIAYFWALYHLKLHYQYRMLNENELTCLLLVPNLLGGFPVINLGNLFVSSESDLLPPFLDIVNHCTRLYPDIAIYLKKFLLVKTIDPRSAFQGLLVDSYSLPISKPTAPGTILRKCLAERLPRLVRHQSVKEIFKLASKEVNEKIEECLFSCNVYNARIMSATFACSPLGYINSLVRRFESGRSVAEALVKVSGRASAERVLLKVISAERSLHEWRIKQLKSKNSFDTDLMTYHDSCPTLWADRIRTTLWGKPVESVTMPPIKHVTFIAQPEEVESNSWAINNHFKFIYNRPIKVLDRYNLPGYQKGGFSPMVGSITRTNLASSSIKLETKNELTQNVQTLLDLTSWVNVTYNDDNGKECKSNYVELIKYILRMYLDVDPETLSVFASVKRSGTIMHHVRAPNYRVAIIPNTLSNIYQCFKGVSNSHDTFRTEGGHYKFNHLQCYCDVVSTLSSNYGYCNNFNLSNGQEFWVVTTDCAHCKTQIMETVLILDQSIIGQLPIGFVKTIAVCDSEAKTIYQAVDLEAPKLQRKISDIRSLNKRLIEYCVLTEHFDEVYLRKVRHTSYIGTNAGNDAGYAHLSSLITHHDAQRVSLTELKKITTQAYVTFLTIYVGDYILSLKVGTTLFDVSAWLSTVKASSHPWYGVIQTIQSLGRLPQVLDALALASMSCDPSCFNDLSKATIYIGQVCYKAYIEGRMYVPPVVIFSAYQILNLSDKVNAQFRYAKHRFCTLSLVPKLNDKDLLRTDNDKYYRVLLMYIYCIYLGTPNEEQINMRLEKMALHSLFTFDWWSHKLIDQDLLLNLMENQSEIDDRVIKRIDEYGTVPYDSVLGDVLDQLEEIEESLTIEFNLSPVDFIYTTYPTCAHRIREEPNIPILPLTSYIRRSHRALCEISPVVQESPHLTWSMRMPKYRNCPRNYVRVPESSLQVPQVHKILLCESEQHRIFSYGSSACNKLLDILLSIGLNKLPPNIKCYNLADGQGGFLALLMNLGVRGEFVFNTLLQEDGIEVYASAALSSVSKQLATIHYGDLNKGFDDLTKSRTCEMLESLISSCNIMTCDAHSSHQTTDQRLRLLSNVITLYLRKRTPMGCLIIKMYTDEVQALSLCAATLTQYCKTVFVCKPISSRTNSELYMVSFNAIADGSNVNYDLSHMCYLPLRSLTNIISKVTALVHTLDAINKDECISVQLDKCLIPRDVKILLDPQYPKLLLNLLGYCCPSGPPSRIVTAVRERMMYVNNVVAGVQAISVSSLKIISDKGGQVLPLQDVNSRRSIQQVFEKWLIAQGFIAVVKKWINRQMRLTLQDCKDNYKLVMEQNCPRRLKLLPITESHFLKDYTTGNFPCNPFGAYMKGVHCALCFLSYINV